MGKVTGLGSNITYLAKSKGFPGRRDTANDSVLFTARGDRAWGWVGFGDDQNSGSVIRRMADLRVDPIVVTEADQYSTAGGVVTGADYMGKAIRNYRFSSVVYPRDSSRTSWTHNEGPSANFRSRGGPSQSRIATEGVAETVPSLSVGQGGRAMRQAP